MRYRAWGETRYAWEGTPTTYRFTGQREDATIQLLFYNARFYDAALGRFIQADTMVPNPADPQSLNRYSYARNNALKYTDPTGHFLDTLIDIVCIGYDLYDIAKNGLDAESGVALVADVGSLVVPFATGGGAAVRAATKVDDVVRVASHADDVVKAVAHLDEVADVATHLDEVAEVAARTADEVGEALRGGEFSVFDWTGYPDGPKPAGPFRVLEGTEYDTARETANRVNRRMHREDPSLRGLDIHEIHPVKLGGSPTDPANKIPLSRPEHAEYTSWWNRLLRSVTEE